MALTHFSIALNNRVNRQHSTQWRKKKHQNVFHHNFHKTRPILQIFGGLLLPQSSANNYHLTRVPALHSLVELESH